ncbi:MAG: Rieske (2Fe-2S) protein [Fuerstiella sp.]|nr:Rieske (2Fe-2S) protein [Fuerstiella sp.]MCP4856472.1 Rieske (2Fe-2S) protein [Fuerstiella sp.]
MSRTIPLISSNDVLTGCAAEVVADGRIFAVYNVDGKFYVLDGICPHAGGPLGKGTLNGPVVTCPWHGWQFDVTNGQHCLNDTLCQPRYVVEILDGQVCVSLPD